MAKEQTKARNICFELNIFISIRLPVRWWLKTSMTNDCTAKFTKNYIMYIKNTDPGDLYIDNENQGLMVESTQGYSSEEHVRHNRLQ
jgi:hypothetical protein